MPIVQDMARELQMVLAAQGMSGRYFRAQEDAATAPGVPMRFLLRHPSLRDEAIANAYGVDALIITLGHCPEFATQAPQRADFIIQGDTLRYVFDAVLCRTFADSIVGWTGYVKGKGL